MIPPAHQMARQAVQRSESGSPPVTTRIESLSHDCAGVAHVDGKTVFIEGALPGELVTFSYRRRKKNHDVAELIEIVEAVALRVEPRCRYFGVCGGCTLQHMDAHAQLEAKQQVVRDNLLHIGKTVAESWLAPVTGPHWGYRRRARLGARVVDKKGGVILGFHERRNSYITPLASCDVLLPAIARLLPATRNLIAGLSCANRIPQVEVSAGDDAVAFVFRHLTPFTDDDRARLAAFGDTHGVRVMLQPQGPDSLHDLGSDIATDLRYDLPAFGVNIAFAANDFIQVNADVNRGLVARAIELLDPQPGDAVLDLFCGLGNFTLPIAKRAGRVLGVEADARMVARARRNAAANGLTHAEFRVCDLYAPDASPDWQGFNKWLIDPPRDGAVEILRRLEPGNTPERIVYVSCHPATLARDAQVLTGLHGYRLAAAGVADMFPQTAHVESIALFVRATEPHEN